MARLRLLLAGDVMTGRGIDQLLEQPLDPALPRAEMGDARVTVRLAEALHGPIPRPVAPSYPWGESLAVMEAFGAEARIVNLETAITTESGPWPGKAVHYRMHPANISCLQAADLDVCCLANNHSLDWGWNGLSDTLRALRGAGIQTTGAGLSPHQALRPAVLPLPAPGEVSGDPAEQSRLLVFAWTLASSGTPPAWSVEAGHPGVAFLPSLDEGTLRWLARFLRRRRRPQDRLLVSLHWGGNWVPEIPEAQRWFARGLIELAEVDLIFGHSSHHPLPFEIHRERLILHGCGDLLNDYEGLGPHGPWRSDLGCLYGVELDRDSGRLLSHEVIPFVRRQLRLCRAEPADLEELAGVFSSSRVPEGWRRRPGSWGGWRWQAPPAS